MKKMTYTVFDAADYLKTEKDIAGFLEAAFEEAGDDPVYIAHVLGIVSRARGMGKVAKKTGLTRQSLYKALSADGNPTIGTVIKVMSALGLKLKIVH